MNSRLSLVTKDEKFLTREVVIPKDLSSDKYVKDIINRINKQMKKE